MILQRVKQKTQGEDYPDAPQTTQVFEKPKIDFDNHTWIQRGYAIYDMCPGCPNQMITIPVGKMLKKEGGKYTITDEG